MALPILAAAKMAKMASVAGKASAAKGKVGAYLNSPSGRVEGISKGQRGWNWFLIIGLGTTFLAIISFVWWFMNRDSRTAPKKMIRPSRAIPRHISSHKEHMFNRGNNHFYKGPEKSMLVTDGNPFQAYVGVNPDGFGETRERMTKSKYRIEDNTHNMIDHDMLEEEIFTDKLKAEEKMEGKQNRNKKRILNNTHNTGHIEQTNELEAAAELSGGNNFTQKFAMNSSKGSNVRAYIKPIERQSTTAHILNFAQIRQ